MGKAVGGLLGGNDQAKAAGKASKYQVAAAERGVDKVQGNFDYIKQLLSPFVGGGTAAFESQADLLGLNGYESEQAALDSIQNGAGFQTQKQLGETSILQNASATGGLRGGNTQLALSQFSPALLQQFVQQRLGNLTNLSDTGLNAAGAVAGSGNSAAQSIAGLLGQAGAAQAGVDIAQGNQKSNTVGQVAGIAGTAAAFFSDKRLKSNIERIGTHRRGFGIYRYEIFGEDQVGVLAQEVEEILPSAVIETASGYKMVDYGAL